MNTEQDLTKRIEEIVIEYMNFNHVNPRHVAEAVVRYLNALGFEFRNVSSE